MRRFNLLIFLQLIAILSLISLFPACQSGEARTSKNTDSMVEDRDPSLTEARPYLVLSQNEIQIEGSNRYVVSYHIISKEADTFEEYAQTAVQAALDLYTYFRPDYTNVILVPEEGIRITYAEAHFAADGKGAEGMTGSAPAKPMYWTVRAMTDPQLTQKQLAIARLWQAKQWDFPQKNPASSLSYDEEALKKYIAATLNIPYEEVKKPFPEMAEYELEQSFIDGTISFSANYKPGNSTREVQMQELELDNVFSESGKKLTEQLADMVSDEIYLEIASLTSPLSPGRNATLTALTEPGAVCNIIIDFGPSGNSSLRSQTADSSGKVSWTWTIGKISGIYAISVTARYGGQTVTRETELIIR
jgi:hypothetical protein